MAPTSANANGSTRPIGVILSAGKGSRIDPFNTRYPKPMLPIVNRPILEHQVEQMKSVGITEIVIVVGHLQEMIREHFGDGSRFGIQIRYVEQKQALGIAHAAMQLERYITGFAQGWEYQLFAAAIALLLPAAYVLLGAAWLIMKTDGDLQRHAVQWAKKAWAPVVVGMGLISVATPLVTLPELSVAM